MTREEAIKRFQQMKKILSIPNSDAVRMIEAIDMAITALQGGDADIPINQSVMQQSRHDDGRIKVVRCKDCRWYKYDSYCSKTEAREIDADNFCSYGERRKNV